MTAAAALSLVAAQLARAAADGRSGFRRRGRCFRGGEPGRRRRV